MSRQPTKKKQPSANTTANTSLTPKEFEPATNGQIQVQRNFNRYDVISCRGMPGTGKTFWLMYLALREILKKGSPYRRLVIVRSTVPVRKSGYLPGTSDEKNAPYKAPYIAHCTKIFGRPDAFEILTKHKMIAFEPTDFLRGTEYNDCIVIVDECQNMSWSELHTINTRFGENCKMSFCGDTGQDDLTSARYHEESGYREMIELHSKIPGCFDIYFGPDDILRSGYVKQYILALYGDVVL